MSAGTIALTNNSTTVGGTGTAFTTELKAGDFVVVIVGGVTYTLGVKAITSATALTLVTAYGGPTATGNAWTAVPNATLVGITSQVAADVAKAIRGLNLDKANWQQVFSGTGTITVTLPDGSTYTGPAWNSITTSIGTKAAKGANTDITSLAGLTTALSIAQGGTGAKTAAAARDSLGLTTGTSVGNVSVVHAGIRNSANLPQKTWDAVYEPFQSGNVFPESCVIQMIPGPTDREWGELGICYGASNRAFIAKASYSSSLPTGNIVVMELKHDKNTTIDSNGFLKAASPIVKIYGDGRYENNDESDGVTVTRLDVGQYHIEGCEALNSDAAWSGIDGGFEIPLDRNKQPRIWIDYTVNADGSITVRTLHRTHPDAPTFAQNIVEGVRDGEPIDIPADSFISVRVEMPENSKWNQRIFGQEPAS